MIRIFEQKTKFLYFMNFLEREKERERTKGRRRERDEKWEKNSAFSYTSLIHTFFLIYYSLYNLFHITFYTYMFIMISYSYVIIDGCNIYVTEVKLRLLCWTNTCRLMGSQPVWLLCRPWTNRHRTHNRKNRRWAAAAKWRENEKRPERLAS